MASLVFENRTFQVGWVLFLFLTLIFVSWPIRNALLVCWVYGSHAYFHQNIRVLPGKPIRFSDGSPAPQFADLVTGFGMFFLTVAGLSVVLLYVLRLYDTHFGRPRTPKPTSSQSSPPA